MPKSGLAIVLTLATSFLTISSAFAEVDQLNLPEPDGHYPVGTRTFVLNDTQRLRELLVTAWYPARATSSSPAPYMDKRTATDLAIEWKLQPDFEAKVRAHARLQSPIAEGERFPVVLLEHGSGVVPAIYTVLAEGLASNGFIVVATNHPPDSLIAVFPDGHEVKHKAYWPENADRRTQGIAIGKFADEVLVADVRFVLDQLQGWNSHDGFWRSHMDLSRVGIVGHSMGGTTAALATKEDARIAVGVNLDGSTYPGMNADVRPIELHKPLLFMATEEHAADPTTHGREYIGSESNTYYVVVAGNDHMGFTDAPLLKSYFSLESHRDNDRYHQALLQVELTRSLVGEFLGKYLKDGIAPELNALLRIDKK